MYVLEGILGLELLALLVMGVWWATARKPKGREEGERAYHVARAFWRAVFDRRRMLAADVVDSLETVAEVDPSTGKKLEDIPTVVVTVGVTGESSCDQIVKFEGDEIKMLVTGPAGSGAANKAVLTMLVEVVGVQAYQVQILRGHYGEKKTVQIQGVDRAEMIRRLGRFL